MQLGVQNVTVICKWLPILRWQNLNGYSENGKKLSEELSLERKKFYKHEHAPTHTCVDIYHQDQIIYISEDDKSVLLLLLPLPLLVLCLLLLNFFPFLEEEAPDTLYRIDLRCYLL